MKQIMITLIFLWLIDCASTSSENITSKERLPKPKKVLIAPDEALIIKNYQKSGKFTGEKNSKGEVIIPLCPIKSCSYIREADRRQIAQLGVCLEKALLIMEKDPIMYMIEFASCSIGKEKLVDADNDGIIDYITPINKDSEEGSCQINLNSDGTQQSIVCELSKDDHLIKRTIDDNENGYPNQFIYFDPKKETKTNLCITKIDYDANNNRHLDKWDYYENCKLVRREIDENENGTVEEITYYNKKGEYDRFWSIGGDNVKKANDALEAKKYDEAISFYKAANQELSKEWGSDSNEVCGNLNRIGETYNAAQKFPDAIKTFNQGLALKKCSDWNYSHLSSGLLLAYALMDDIKMIIKSGIDAAKQYAKTNEGKKHFEIEGFLGYGYYKEKEYQEAYKHLLPALELTLQEQKESCKGEKRCSYFNPFYFSMFGNICSRLNKNAEAIAYYKKALEFRSQLPPEQVDSFEFSFAYQTYIAGDPKKAISMNERFLNNKDTKKAALVNHAFFHLALEDLQKANQFMKTAVAAGLQKDDWDEDIEFFKIYYPKQASLLPEIIKTSGQY